jgi:hypothetical protein
MNRRTSQGQRKMKMPNLVRRKPKKKVVEQPKEEVADASCQTQGCGCGN